MDKELIVHFLFQAVSPYALGGIETWNKVYVWIEGQSNTIQNRSNHQARLTKGGAENMIPFLNTRTHLLKKSILLYLVFVLWFSG